MDSKKDPDNPWIADSNEYAQFVTNYKKFWEEKSSTETEKQAESEENFTNDSDENLTSAQTELDPSVELANKNKKRKVSRKKEKVSKKSRTVAQIINRSGSWTVTENEPEQDELQESETKVDKPSKASNKKSSEAQNDSSKSPLITDQDFVELGADLQANESKVELPKPTSSDENIDPNKYAKANAKRLMTELPEIITGGDEGIDDEDEDFQQPMTIDEAFADDDVVAEFE